MSRRYEVMSIVQEKLDALVGEGTVEAAKRIALMGLITHSKKVIDLCRTALAAVTVSFDQEMGQQIRQFVRSILELLASGAVQPGSGGGRPSALRPLLHAAGLERHFGR